MKSEFVKIGKRVFEIGHDTLTGRYCESLPFKNDFDRLATEDEKEFVISEIKSNIAHWEGKGFNSQAEMWRKTLEEAQA